MADVHVLYQLLSCHQRLLPVGHGVRALPNHQTVKFLDVGSSSVAAARTGNSQ